MKLTKFNFDDKFVFENFLSTKKRKEIFVDTELQIEKNPLKQAYSSAQAYRKPFQNGPENINILVRYVLML